LKFAQWLSFASGARDAVPDKIGSGIKFMATSSAAAAPETSIADCRKIAA
jgi:hypothetical protein